MIHSLDKVKEISTTRSAQKKGEGSESNKKGRRTKSIASPLQLQMNMTE